MLVVLFAVPALLLSAETGKPRIAGAALAMKPIPSTHRKPTWLILGG